MEWINCNRDIFRKAIRILASRRFNLKKKKKKRETTIEILPDSVSNVFVQSNTFATSWQFLRGSRRNKHGHELITRAYWCIQSLKFRRFYDEHRNEFAELQRTFPSPLRSSYHSHAFPRCLINHRKMMFRSNSVSTANLAYPFL